LETYRSLATAINSKCVGWRLDQKITSKNSQTEANPAKD